MKSSSLKQNTNNHNRKKSELLTVICRTLRQNKLLTLGLLITILGAVGLALLPPLVLEQILNRLASGKLDLGQLASINKQVDLRGIITLAILYFGLLALAGLFDSGKEVFITVFGQKITRGLRHEMCQKLSVLPAAYFVEHESGKTTSRFVNDVDEVESLFTNGIVSMFADACKVLSIITVIWIKSTGLGILLLLVTPLLLWLTRAFQKRMQRAQLKNREAIAKVNNHIPETIHNSSMIRSFSKQKYMEKKYDSYIQESYRAVEKTNLYDSLYSPIIIFISTCIIAIMMSMSSVGGEFQNFFGMSVGSAVAIITYVGKVFDPLEAIGMEIQNIQSAIAGVKKINEFMKEPEKKLQDSQITADKLFKEQSEKNTELPCIEFRDVVFGYEQEKMVLDNLSFVVKNGESVTLAGRTGAGKSTIVKMILGLYSPIQGQVLVMGAHADQIPDAQKRKIFGYVEQSFQIVEGTIADQISLFDTNISKEQIEAAARLVGMHETIQNLELGYETPCTQLLFSQGQFQLLSIARAVAAGPSILLLDEMTANLDSETEVRVLDALREASKNRTVISISHRLYEQLDSRLISI